MTFDQNDPAIHAGERAMENLKKREEAIRKTDAKRDNVFKSKLEDFSKRDNTDKSKSTGRTL